MPSTTALIVAAAAPVAAAGTVGGLALLGERKRAADADRYRNHELRVKAASDFLEAFDAFRRAVRDEPENDLSSGADSKAVRRGQELADVVGRVDLFFDDDVVNLAKCAQKKADWARDPQRRPKDLPPGCGVPAADELTRDGLLKQAEHARDCARAGMKRRLEPTPRKRWK
jgi:hypothetical protein